MIDRGLVVREVVLRDFRSYEGLELELEPGLVLVSGANGAGKTNLLEAIHLGTQGFSPRVRGDAQLIRFGSEASRVTLRGGNDGRAFESDVVLRRDDARQARLNGDALRSAEQLRDRFRTLVFTPDRLAVVKGAPATRRAYLDRSLTRLFPGRANAPAEYGSALGQRNAALRRVGQGLSSRDAVSPWTERVALTGAELVAARRAAVDVLAGRFAEITEDLGLEGAAIAYDGEAPSTDELDGRLDRDLERGFTGAGPHLHDVRVEAGGRELRTYGSQGEQRTAVLALVLAEAGALTERSGSPPLVLLDDVLSELDESRRRRLAELLLGGSQTLVTTTTPDALPLAPTLSLVVSGGTVKRA